MKTIGIVAQVNQALKAKGVAERLARGRGYSYFRGGNTGNWRETAVYVSDPGALSVDEWLEEFERLRKTSWGVIK